MKAIANESGDRCLHWALAEDLGGEQPPDLTAEVHARAAAGRWPDEAPVAAPANWRIAAWMAAGIAVAVGTAWLARSPATRAEVPAALPQDPQPPGKSTTPAQEPQWVAVSKAAEVEALPLSCLALRLRNWTPSAAAAPGGSTRAGIANALDRTPKLQQLDLDADETSEQQLDELDLKRLGAQVSLRELRLGGRAEIVPAWLGSLAALPALTSLALPRVAVGDEGAAALARIPALQSLELAFDATLSDAGLASLATMPGLRNLSLRGCGQLTPAGLQRLGACRQLERLDLRFCNGLVAATPRGVPARLLARSEQMMMAEMVLATKPGGGVDDDALTAIAKATRLRELLLTGCPTVTAKGLAALTTLPLKKLAVSIRTGTATEWVEAMPPTIEELSLAWSSGLDDAAAEALPKRLPQLRAIELFQCTALTDRGLQLLLAGTALVELDLRGCTRLTGESLQVLLAAKSLQVLDVSGQPWATAGASSLLQRMPAMRELRNRRGGTMLQFAK